MKTMSVEEKDVFENTNRSLEIIHQECSNLNKTNNISEFNKVIEKIVLELDKRKFKL